MANQIFRRDAIAGRRIRRCRGTGPAAANPDLYRPGLETATIRARRAVTSG